MKHGGAHAPGAPPVPTPMGREVHCTSCLPVQLCSACIAVPDNADQQGNSYFLFQPLGEKDMYTNILALNTGFLFHFFVSQFWKKLQTEILVLSNYVHTCTYTCTLPYILTSYIHAAPFPHNVHMQNWADL